MSKIIVADDEQLIRSLVSDFLEKAGYTVLQAEDGAKALELFNENRDVALCILDIMMPELDGWEVCRRIRSTSDVPIMLLTARSQDFDQIVSTILEVLHRKLQPFDRFCFGNQLVQL